MMAFSINDFADDVELYEDDDDELAPAYKDDIGFFRGLRREKNCLSMLLTLIMYGLIALLSTNTYKVLHLTSNEFRAVFLIMYGVYLIESLGSAASAYLWHYNGDEEDSQERVRGMLDSAPWIRWTLHSYHYPNPQAAMDGRPGNRIRSYSARGEFELSGCTDATNATLFTSHQLCMMSFEKSREWRDDEAKAAYENAKFLFTEQNKRDTHVELVEEWGIEGWIDRILTSRVGEKMPFWANWYFFLLTSVFLVGFWYRTVFASRTGSRRVKVSKVIW